MVKQKFVKFKTVVPMLLIWDGCKQFSYRNKSYTTHIKTSEIFVFRDSSMINNIPLHYILFNYNYYRFLSSSITNTKKNDIIIIFSLFVEYDLYSISTIIIVCLLYVIRFLITANILPFFYPRNTVDNRWLSQRFRRPNTW